MSRTGSDGPVCTVPFPGGKLLGAFALDTDSVLFVGVGAAKAGGEPLLLAHYDLRSSRIVLRREVVRRPGAFLFLSRDRRRLIASGSGGVVVVCTATLEAVARWGSERREGRRITYVPAEADDFADGSDPAAVARIRERRAAGWRIASVQFAFELGEVDAARLIFVNRWPDLAEQGAERRDQRFDVIDWRAMTGHTVAFRSAEQPTALDLLDPDPDLLHVTRDQLALFRASPPASTAEAGPFACTDPALHAVVLILWRLGGGEPPRFVAVREAEAEAWLAGARRHLGYGKDDVERDDDDRLRPLREASLLPSPRAEVSQPALWATAAARLLVAAFEDPRNGLIWLSFADDHIRSLDGAGTLGPLIRLDGAANVADDDPHSRNLGPRVSFLGEDLVIAKVHGRRYGDDKMARYAFRASDVAGETEPVTLMPARPGPLPGSHAKSFAAYVRERRRDRLVLPDWGRDSVAAALEAQRAAIAAGLPDLVDPEEDRLAISYKVAGKSVREAAFFRRIATDALPVVPELRALLLTYTDALGEGGEGVQPWQEPEKGVGGLGPALHALALLDPNCVDVMRAYLETRDGEHEAYALDVVVPAFFERHGWCDAAAVRFGIYATLNRFWGGRRPPEGSAGLRDAMARLLTPEEAAEAVLREAEHFGRRPEWGYDAAAYREAFRSLLDAANPFEAAVRNAMDED